MKRLSAPDRTREELRALIGGDLGMASGRSDLVRLALRLIVEEPLEGEVSNAVGRERYERAEGAPRGIEDTMMSPCGRAAEFSRGQWDRSGLRSLTARIKRFSWPSN